MSYSPIANIRQTRIHCNFRRAVHTLVMYHNFIYIGSTEGRCTLRISRRQSSLFMFIFSSSRLHLSWSRSRDAWTAACLCHALTQFPLRSSVYRATLPCNLCLKLHGPRALGQWPRGHPTPAAEPNAMMQGDCSSRWTVQLARPVIERQLDILSLLGGATLYIEDGIYFCAYRAAYNTRRA